jgi:hypothetical protein
MYSLSTGKMMPKIAFPVLFHTFSSQSALQHKLKSTSCAHSSNHRIMFMRYLFSPSWLPPCTLLKCAWAQCQQQRSAFVICNQTDIELKMDTPVPPLTWRESVWLRSSLKYNLQRPAIESSASTLPPGPPRPDTSPSTNSTTGDSSTLSLTSFRGTVSNSVHHRFPTQLHYRILPPQTTTTPMMDSPGPSTFSI